MPTYLQCVDVLLPTGAVDLIHVAVSGRAGGGYYEDVQKLARGMAQRVARVLQEWYHGAHNLGA